MEIINKSRKDLIPYKNNPRKNDEAVEYVANSIREFGFKNPVIIDKNNIIVAGHTRVKAAERLGIEEIPCIMADDLTDEQIKAFRLADNKVGEIAEWDSEMLDLELLDIDMDMTDFGFEFDDKEEETEVIEDDYNIEPPAEPKAKYGDIYQLGRHRLMCGDATKIEDVEKLMDGAKADITFTSPPYNAGTTPTEVKAGNITKYNGNNDNKSENEYRLFLNQYLKNSLEYSEYSFMNIQSLSNNKLSLINVLYDNKDIYADTIIWDKMHSQPAMAENVLNSEFEYIHIFSKKGNRSIGTKRFRGNISNIIHIGKQNKNDFSDIHNATFSIEFASFFVKNFSNKSVLELFCGTGTTLISCEQLNKTCYAMELEPKYIDVIIDRWEQFTGEKAIKIIE